MTKFSVEAKVGIFVVAGMIILAYMAIRTGRFDHIAGKGYEVIAYFDSAEGIVTGAPVEIAGVEVGRVKEVSLQEGKAKLILYLNPEVEITEGSEAAVRTKGVLGDKYVEVIVGPPGAAPVGPGGRIAKTQSPANIDTLLRQLSSIGTDIKEITSSLSGVLGGEQGQASLKEMVKNIQEMAETLNRTIKENNDNINRMLENLALFSDDLMAMSGTNKEAVQEIVENFRTASNQLRGVLVSFNEITEKINQGEGTIGRLINEEQTVNTINETLVAMKEIAEKIKRGEGTLGRLVQEDQTVENLNDTLTSINQYLGKQETFRTYLDYRGEYLFDVDDLKSYLSLQIKPKEDKYYLLQIVDDPGGRKRVTETTTTVGGVSTTEVKEEIDKDEIKFSAQIAKRYYDLGLRAGIFESTGGVGADYYFFDDRLTLSVEAFDFDPDENPHLKFKADFTPFRYIYLTGGADDFISDEGDESAFVGAGLRFSDEDLKTLLSNAPIPNR